MTADAVSRVVKRRRGVFGKAGLDGDNGWAGWRVPDVPIIGCGGAVGGPYGGFVPVGHTLTVGGVVTVVAPSEGRRKRRRKSLFHVERGGVFCWCAVDSL